MMLRMCVVLVCVVSCTWAIDILRPRGVSASNAVLYDAEKDFTCIDGSNTVPFQYVNDDYCDCQDGSDEPGTAACPNGSFFCANVGHASVYIPSSRVNDGICDCCDTSDEYGSSSPCINTCKELGRAAREKELKFIELQRKGFELRNELKEKGRLAREEMKLRLQELETRKLETAAVLEEKRLLKEEAEAPEKEALEVYRQKEEEERKRREEEELQTRLQEATEAFNNLDSNQDEKLDISEIQTHARFDQNHDGVVSEEEARFFLSHQDEISKEEFLETGWKLMKSYYQLDNSGIYIPPTETPEEEETMKYDSSEEEEVKHEFDEDSQPEFPDEASLEDDGDDEHTDHEDEDEEEQEEEEDEEETDKTEEHAESIDEEKYDDETKRLIEIASQARHEFEEVDRASRDLEREITNLKYTLGKNWGKNDEFQPLEGQCFEYEDREYIYTLCPFDKASQKPKHGGSETKLGIWGHWDDEEGQKKYSKMIYDKGVQCWNGPMRSVEVRLSCDIENRITAVSEPSRCEYLFLFSTPAVCDEPSSGYFSHDEL